jgi:predicted ferric reductase
MNGITSSTALWYASRATGVVALVLLTAVMVLGILVHRQGRLPGLPRFAATSLHRSASLLSVAFVGLHVVTAIADPYVSIRAVAAVVPFASSYKPFWLGLGALALDLMIALIVTSLVRARIGRHSWRAVHWLAYASWPVAFVHGITSSTDLQHGRLLDLAILCCIAIAGALVWRAAGSAFALPRTERAARVLADTSVRRPQGRDAEPTARRANQKAEIR